MDRVDILEHGNYCYYQNSLYEKVIRKAGTSQVYPLIEGLATQQPSLNSDSDNLFVHIGFNTEILLPQADTIIKLQNSPTHDKLTVTLHQIHPCNANQTQSKPGKLLLFVWFKVKSGNQVQYLQIREFDLFIGHTFSPSQ